MKQVVNKLVGQYRKAVNAQFQLSVLFCDNYAELSADFAQAGTLFGESLQGEYGESLNMAMIARSLKEAKYSVEEASAFLYAVQKSLGLTGASSALTNAGYELPNKNGGGRPPVSAVDAAVKALKKVLEEKKPNKKQKAAILAAVTELLG